MNIQVLALAFLATAAVGGLDQSAGVAAHEQHPRTLLAQPPSDLVTDPAAGPGHDAQLVLQPEVHGRPSLPGAAAARASRGRPYFTEPASRPWTK